MPDPDTSSPHAETPPPSGDATRMPEVEAYSAQKARCGSALVDHAWKLLAIAAVVGILGLLMWA